MITASYCRYLISRVRIARARDSFLISELGRLALQLDRCKDKDMERYFCALLSAIYVKWGGQCGVED